MPEKQSPATSHYGFIALGHQLPFYQNKLTLIGKNIFDEDYKTGAATYSGTNAVTEQPGYGGAFSLAFRANW